MAIGWAMIGTGRVHESMVPALKEARDTKLVAVCSRDKARAVAFAKEHGIERAYDSLDELVHDPEVNVVYVASPNALHAEQTIKAAEAKKHVFCEKPMALTLKECHLMIEACQKNGVKLGLGVMYRQHPAHIKAHQFVASGDLGQLILVKAQIELMWRVQQPRWYFEPGMSGGGIVYMAGVHRIDLLRFILGCEISEVSALIGEQPPERPYEETAMAMAKFDNGACGMLNFYMNIPHGTTSLEVHGSKASLYLMDTTALWWGGGGGELLLKSSTGTVRYQYEKTNLYKDEVEDFNRCILEGGQPAGAGIDGLRSAEVCIAMFDSGRQGKVIRLQDLRSSANSKW